jgi:5-methylcytosine-specific restriction endonuclease McrA
MVKVRRNLYKRPKRKRKVKRKSSSRKLLKDWSIKVRGRDGFTCLNCGSKKYTHAHHMVSKYYIPEYTLFLDNGITLCKSCHTGPQGVHGSKKPKSSFIKLLRLIYKTGDIKKAVSLRKKIDSRP